jgi:hypothetical protein
MAMQVAVVISARDFTPESALRALARLDAATAALASPSRLLSHVRQDHADGRLHARPSTELRLAWPGSIPGEPYDAGPGCQALADSFTASTWSAE